MEPAQELSKAESKGTNSISKRPHLCRQPTASIATSGLEGRSGGVELKPTNALFFTIRPKISVGSADKSKAFVISASVSLVTKRKDQNKKVNPPWFFQPCGSRPCPFYADICFPLSGSKQHKGGTNLWNGPRPLLESRSLFTKTSWNLFASLQVGKCHLAQAVHGTINACIGLILFRKGELCFTAALPGRNHPSQG